MDFSLFMALAALGAFVGFCAGLLGIGGGMLAVPFLTFLFSARGFAGDHVVHIAIATSLATILFTSLTSMRTHHRHGAVLWPVVAALVPGLLIGSWLGPWIGARLSTVHLSLVFACFVAFSATQMWLDKKPKPQRELPGPFGMLGAGSVIGTLGGLVGAGGGFVSVPFMTWCNVRIHQAVATSAALGFPIALAGTLSNAYHGRNVQGLPDGALGYIYLPALVAIACTSMLTAPFGARLAHRLNVKTLKRVFACMLYGLAAYMLAKALGKV